ncbi:hypothetical protein H5410_033117 [Solanum commersonii]|uniref:Uncharacterized protein n=1 Tax=Solanum commersonii TaxID=4109 RepID=A0A9J5YLW5_SOLCO|nr:hypothetical protein H5410_033117 [Solanum commersonii]
MAQLHITEDMTLDRKEWRSRIKVEVSLDPKSIKFALIHIGHAAHIYANRPKGLDPFPAGPGDRKVGQSPKFTAAGF